MASRWKRGLGWVSAGLALAVFVTIAVISSGFDAQLTPREDPSVWVMRDSGQYARVNTETAEIDTVRVAESPSELVQSDGDGLLFTQAFGRVTPIDPTAPQDVRDSDSSQSEADSADTAGAVAGAGTGSTLEAPIGTRQVLASSEEVLYLTESGEALLARVERPAETIRLDIVADAAAIDNSGAIAVYSRGAGGVQWFEGSSGEPTGNLQEIPEPPAAAQAQLTIVAGSWALLDADQQVLWREGSAEGLSLDLADGAILQQPSSRAASPEERVLIADRSGLLAVDGRGAERVAEASGSPAQPAPVGDGMAAAWVDGLSATLWTSESGLTPLDFDASVEEVAEPDPVIRQNGRYAVLTEMSTGLLWRIPDGRLIPISQWNLSDPPRESSGTVVAQDVTQQEPPVAKDDSFGVRAGDPAQLQVLLNDYDPNRKDVLTIVADGLGRDLPAEFGRVELLGDAQSMVVEVLPSATGTASLTYRVTDGVAVSQPATVQLRVAAPDENTAPEWCAVEGCQRSWPSPAMTPGGTLVVPVLDGWVDPESDPMSVTSLELLDPQAPVHTMVTGDGRIAVRHTDANAGAGSVAIRVSIADAHGAVANRELKVRIDPAARASFAPMATTVASGETAVLHPLERVTGGSGSYTLVDAVDQSRTAGSAQARVVQPQVRQSSGTVGLLADRPGTAVIALTLHDEVTEQEISGVVRVTVTSERAPLALPPMRAFVKPLADTTVEVLQAVPNADTRALSIRSASAVPAESSGSDTSDAAAALRVDVIEHERIRVSGSTADGKPGRIGSVDVVVAERSTIAHGRLTVFQVGSTSAGAIAVADSAVVRAGSVVDIPVLRNDLAPPGDRLLLSPKVTASRTDGELAFASGSQLRYLAPKTPGTYTVGYSTYSASAPDQSDGAEVRITVLPPDTNRAPEPLPLTARVAPGETAQVQVPTSGADPDGDRLRLMAVGAARDPQLSTSIVARSNAIEISASRSAKVSTQAISYTVRDGYGGQATGELRVIVTEPDATSGGPVAYSDYVRIAVSDSDEAPGAGAPVGAAAIVRPLDNDLDPSGGKLEIIKVVPNVVGNAGSEQYLELARHLDASDLRRGVLRITPGLPPGTVSYRYIVRSNESTGTADGLIVVQTGAHVGRQAPSVADTVLSVADRAALESTGIDVVTDQVRWSTGDVSTLSLSLWGASAERYRVSGNSIVGAYRPEGDQVIFRLSGVDSSGEKVETFGFMIVPPLDELRLTLKNRLAPVRVEEGEQIDVPLAELLDLGPRDRVELAPGEYPVQRNSASCHPAGAATLQYRAGSGGPWNDTCTIRVRLTEQTSYTVIPVPIEVVPTTPIAMLNPLMRTVAPGVSTRINLEDMLVWQGGRAGESKDLRWKVIGGGSLFKISQNGSQLTVQADAGAASGSQEALHIEVSGGTVNSLTLRIGEAARDAPRGATVTATCTVGSECSAALVGVPGEYDPFAGKLGGGLHVVSLGTEPCAVGELELRDDRVRVNWPSTRSAGGSCTVSFTVRDAQNRTGTGTFELETRGIPSAPTSLATIAYTATSVTIRVTPGAESHPAVSSVSIRRGGAGSAIECTPDGATYLCEVTGLTAGEQHSFVAVARNAVGESDPSTALTSWAYQPPAAPNIQDAKQVPGDTPDATTETRGTVHLKVHGGSDVKEYRVLLNQSVFATLPGNHVDTNLSMPVGAHTLKVIPISRFGSPIDGGDNKGAAATQALTVAGLPVLGEPETSYDVASETLTVTIHADANSGGALKLGAAIGDTCEVDNLSGTTRELPLSASDGQSVRITVCAQNDWGANSRVTDIVIDAPAPVPAP